MDKIIEPVPTPMPDPAKREDLEPGQELRIFKIEEHIKLLLLEGKAEIFGRELPLKQPLYFHQGDKLALYTYHGARVLFSGKCEHYVSKQTPMTYYLNIHSAFN